MRNLRAACIAAWQQTMAGFTSLSGSPRDLFVVYALKALESYNYFSLSRCLTLYLTEEFGVSDYRAGFFYGVWGTLLTAYGFLLGGAIDYLGVRRSLVLSFLLNCSSRLVMAATQSRTLLLIMLLGPNCIAGSLGVPVMTIGIKRYTHEGNRGFAFALFYTLMNCSALTQGLLMDLFRIDFKHGFQIHSLPDRSLLNNGSRLFLASGCITSLVGLLVSLMLNESAQLAPKRTGSEVLEGSTHSHRTTSSAELELPTSPEVPLLLGSGDSRSNGAAPSHVPRHRLHGGYTPPEGDTPAEGQERPGSGSIGGVAAPAAGQPSQGASLLEGVRDVLSSRGFLKFLCMCILTSNLKTVFRHLDATLPKYQLRAFGCDFPIGLVYSINPFMIVLLVPIVGAMTTGYQHFDMIHYGGYVSALSPFIIVALNSELSTILFVAVLSLGEAIWSPRCYDYSMGIAPHGREGIFTALSSAPLFIAQLPTGMLSGALLQAYCPDNAQCGGNQGQEGRGRRLLMAAGAGCSGRRLQGLVGASAGLGDVPPPEMPTCNGRALWAIVGAITLSSPLLVLLTQVHLGAGSRLGCESRRELLCLCILAAPNSCWSLTAVCLPQQRWIRPDPQDFAKADAGHRGRSPTEGEYFDINAADPTDMLENVCVSSLLHAPDGGIESPAVRPGSAGTSSQTASGERSGMRSAG